MSSSTQRTSCILCDSAQLEIALPIKPSPIADAYIPADRLAVPQPVFPLDLHLCRSCGHVQLREVVNPMVLFADYIYRTSASASLVEHFRKYVDDLLTRFTAPDAGLAFDIGSNDGTFLRLLKARGLRVLGVDPASGIAQEATESGIPTVNGFFTSTLARTLRGEHGPAMFVSANNVFAHSEHLADMADGVREMLAPDGIFVFEVSYLADIVDKRLFDTVYHEHLSYHSVKPLDSFLARHGLELVDVVRIASKGGSIRCFAQRSGGPHQRAAIVDELIAQEEATGLGQPGIFAKLTASLAATKAEVHELLESFRANNERIVGFGASATVTTLVFNFELGRFLNHLVDDNEARHGLFSPGLHLPVRPAASLRDERPENVVILAWQYATPILAKHSGYRPDGRFILPMPDVRTVTN